MTLAELDRFFKSRARVIKAQEQKQASFDYILADTIGRSIARIYNSSNKMPSIEEVYRTLFDSEEIRAAKAARDRERFVASLQQFAQTHNKEVGKDK